VRLQQCVAAFLEFAAALGACRPASLVWHQDLASGQAADLAAAAWPCLLAKTVMDLMDRKLSCKDASGIRAICCRRSRGCRTTLGSKVETWMTVCFDVVLSRAGDNRVFSSAAYTPKFTGDSGGISLSPRARSRAAPQTCRSPPGWRGIAL
jgi:hypothetical protein